MNSIITVVLPYIMQDKYTLFEVNMSIFDRDITIYVHLPSFQCTFLITLCVLTRLSLNALKW